VNAVISRPHAFADPLTAGWQRNGANCIVDVVDGMNCAALWQLSAGNSLLDDLIRPGDAHDS